MTTVQILDNKIKFDGLSSNHKTTSGLSGINLTRYTTVFNHFLKEGKFGLTPANKVNIGWYGEHWKEILAWINETYKKPSSKRAMLDNLSGVLLHLEKNTYKEIVRAFYNEASKIQKEIDKKDGANELTEDEIKNFVTYPELVRERTRLFNEWTKDMRNLKLNMYHLILALNTYIPPLRKGDWLEMHVWPPRLKDGKVIKPVDVGEPPENSQNYLWEVAPDKWALVMQQDKVSNKKLKRGEKKQVITLSDEIQGVTNGNALNAILGHSLREAPRNFVLVNEGGKEPLGGSSYDSALATMFAPKKPTQNVFREAFINFYYPKVSFNVQNEIASRMRHSVMIALKSYRKLNIEDSEEKRAPPTVFATPPVTLPILTSSELATIPIAAEVKQAPKLPPKKYFDPSAYAKKYRAEHLAEITEKQTKRYDAKKLLILRDKMLAQLNRGQVKQPTAKSIEVYQLSQDPVSGKWLSGLA